MFILTRDELGPALRRLRRLAANPFPVTRAMGTTFKSITEGTFNSAGASFRPIPWAAKADGTPSNLQKSTTMSKSFHLENDATTATVSNPMPYAAIHQFGGEIKQPKKELLYTDEGGGKHFKGDAIMPARPFFPVVDGHLTPKAEALILRAGERALAAEAAKI